MILAFAAAVVGAAVLALLSRSARPHRRMP